MAKPVAHATARIGPWEQRLDRLVLALGRSPFGASGHGRPRGILNIFRLVERLLERGHTYHALYPGGIVRYEIAPLPARPLRLRDGTLIPRGERVVIVHFDNRAIAALDGAGSTQALAWQLVRAGRDDMRALAALARQGALPVDVRAVWAETLFYLAPARYGFATRPARRGPRTVGARLFLLALLAIYGRDGAAGVDPGQLPLGEAWIGLDELQRCFTE